MYVFTPPISLPLFPLTSDGLLTEAKHAFISTGFHLPC